MRGGAVEDRARSKASARPSKPTISPTSGPVSTVPSVTKITHLEPVRRVGTTTELQVDSLEMGGIRESCRWPRRPR